MKTYREHQLSQLLPMMPDADLLELAADIKQNGLRAPITLLDGKVLDGRNRYKACRIAGVEPRFKDFNGDGDPLAFIISANVRRRHLTESQRAMIAARLANMRHGGDRRGDEAGKRPPPKGPLLKPSEKARVSQAAAAKQLEVSPRTVRTAKKVLEEAAPEDIAAIERGEKTVTEVARDTKAKKEGPEEQLDKTGHPIPPDVLFDWQRAEETSRSLLSRVSALRSELKKALDEQDVIFSEVTNTAVADFNNAYTSLKGVKPYAVCTSCQGHGRAKCSLCKGRGFISEFAWRSFVPEEIKNLRGAQ